MRQAEKALGLVCTAKKEVSIDTTVIVWVQVLCAPRLVGRELYKQNSLGLRATLPAKLFIAVHLFTSCVPHWRRNSLMLFLDRILF